MYRRDLLLQMGGYNSNMRHREEEELRKELLNLKISLSSGQLKEIHKIKEIKRSIAQLKTIQKETLKEQNNDG